MRRRSIQLQEHDPPCDIDLPCRLNALDFVIDLNMFSSFYFQKMFVCMAMDPQSSIVPVANKK